MGKRDGAVAAHEAVVPYLHETCGQDMLEKAPDELDDIEGYFSTAIAALLTIGEGNGSIFDSHDSGIGDSQPGALGGKVFQGCLAASYGLAVDGQGHLSGWRIDFVKQPLPGDFGLQFGSEYLG